ncbi:DUF1257 domain-containing protein [Phormidium tenue]|jgi:hypothetical protein|uniref:DUF1257 domain-containing protein n=1 Tax=Phormidium tenue FACHB-1050 TaxID=2692857 RepID=A0ABR8CEQ6_9CYAN|nr:DUF1257 domain-containing protein [Phormidium tenue]MBD2318014.1 DUF1257 domain-containing protein [Phormidium tenue FACHB-1050]
MSHFSQVKTQIRSLEPLQKALTDLGVNWKSGASPMRGHEGTTTSAEVVIEQANGYDVGFQWNGSEYALVADMQFWQQPWTVESFLRKVTQGYAIATVMGESSEQGFSLSEQQVREDGSVRLVLQRWNG